jgi:cysteinyl-tRNA synthetase
LILRIFNTLSGLKDKATPRDGILKMLICGPTVYDFSHLGHARILLFYDLVTRYLMLNGMRIIAILNITDIDPKISARAKAERSSVADISNRFINELLIDIQSLGINTFSIARTSDYVETSRKLILGLLSEKRGYFTNGNVYLDTSSLDSYGKLSRLSRQDLVNRRVDIAPGKKTPSDILLWNGSDDFGQKYYDSSLGEGIPWWHMQDSSVAMSIFNGIYDIHGGATELVYPHHESILAQLRTLTSNQQPIQIWNHVGLVSINGKKMSKSFGNIIRIRDLLRKYGSNIIRLYLFSKHYRQPLVFSQSELDEFYSTDEMIASALWENADSKNLYRRTGLTNEFASYLEDDVDTSAALELLIETARKREYIADLRYMVRIFGLVY